jgi:hypothetical protein
MVSACLAFVASIAPSCTPNPTNLITVTYEDNTGGSSPDTLQLQSIKREEIGPLGRIIDPITINYVDSTGGSSPDTLQAAVLPGRKGKIHADTIYFLARKSDTLFLLAIRKEKPGKKYQD